MSQDHFCHVYLYQWVYCSTFQNVGKTDAIAEVVSFQ